MQVFCGLTFSEAAKTDHGKVCVCYHSLIVSGFQRTGLKMLFTDLLYCKGNAIYINMIKSLFVFYFRSILLFMIGICLSGSFGRQPCFYFYADHAMVG